MSVVVSRPLTDEQLRERERKIAERQNAQLQADTDLIIAELLEKISRLEANQND